MTSAEKAKKIKEEAARLAAEDKKRGKDCLEQDSAPAFPSAESGGVVPMRGAAGAEAPAVFRHQTNKIPDSAIARALEETQTTLLAQVFAKAVNIAAEGTLSSRQNATTRDADRPDIREPRPFSAPGPAPQAVR